MAITLQEHAKLPASKAHGPNAKLAKGGKVAGYKKSGPTSEDRMKMGKNLSRVANQKSG